MVSVTLSDEQIGNAISLITIGGKAPQSGSDGLIAAADLIVAINNAALVAKATKAEASEMDTNVVPIVPSGH